LESHENLGIPKSNPSRANKQQPFWSL